MKKMVELISIIALVAFTGFSMIACPDDKGGDGSTQPPTP